MRERADVEKTPRRAERSEVERSESLASFRTVASENGKKVFLGSRGEAPGEVRAAMRSADDFAVFVRLREARKELAEKEAIPVYAVCTNEQLAEIAKGRAATMADLKGIDRFGDAKAEEFGAAFLAAMHGADEAKDEAGEGGGARFSC